MEQHERLRQYNRWRRGEEDWSADDRGPDPKEIGVLIDSVADRLEVLERENREFYNRWHEERMKRQELLSALEGVLPFLTGPYWPGVEADAAVDRAIAARTK